MINASCKESVKKVIRGLDEFERRIRFKTNFIMGTEAATAHAEMASMTPIDTGRLVSGVKCQKITGENTIIASAHAVDPQTQEDYAWIQHETTTFHHRVGQDHFVSIPFEAMIERIVERMVTEIDY